MLQTASHVTAFQTSVKVVKDLADEKGDDIGLALSSKNVVSCPHEVSVQKYQQSPDVTTCLSVSQQRKGLFSACIGLPGVE